MRDKIRVFLPPPPLLQVAFLALAACLFFQLPIRRPPPGFQLPLGGPISWVLLSSGGSSATVQLPPGGFWL